MHRPQLRLVGKNIWSNSSGRQSATGVEEYHTKANQSSRSLSRNFFDKIRFQNLNFHLLTKNNTQNFVAYVQSFSNL